MNTASAAATPITSTLLLQLRLTGSAVLEADGVADLRAQLDTHLLSHAGSHRHGRDTPGAKVEGGVKVEGRGEVRFRHTGSCGHGCDTPDGVGSGME